MTSTGNASLNPAILTRGNPIRWLVFGGAILVAGIVAGTAITADIFRERAISDAGRELENTVLLLDRHFNQQLGDFVAIQREFAQHIQQLNITSPETFRKMASTTEMHESLKLRNIQQSDVAGLNIFDADGQLINSSKNWPVPNVNVADTNFYKEFKSGLAKAPLSIELRRNRFGEGWATVLAYRLNGPHGEFLGIATRGLTPEKFESFFASLALGDKAAIAVYHEGMLLARYPHVENMIGMVFQGTDSRREVLSGTRYVRLISPIDGLERLAARRVLNDFPIAVIASTTVEAALTNWRAETRFLTAAATASVLLIAIMLFVSVRKLSAQYQRERERLDTAINNMAQGLLLFNSSERLVIFNQRYVEMSHVSTDIVKPGCTFRELLEYRKATGWFTGDVEQYRANALQKMTGGKVFQTVVDTPDGNSVQILYRPLPHGGWVTTLEDITDRKRAEARITHLAHYDALTDLPNRALFHERLRQELSQISEGEQLAVFYIDIDEFKSVNDTLGHLIGDELLKSVAKNLSACVTGNDFVARLGGDEFAIVQTSVTSQSDASAMAARIFDAIRLPYDCLGHQVITDASVGVALAPHHGDDLEKILKSADLAMYAAKSAGRHTYRFFEPEMDARVKARRVLELELRQAVADQAFEVYYQPCVGLQTNEVTGCEALLRWRHPHHGFISPADFIPIAEETGLINEIGEWVLTTACAEAANWPEHIRLAVNVSPVQFRSKTFALKVVSALAQSGLAPSRLELEITEAVLIRDDEIALAILHQLRAIGVRIALDDFGTGYSSLSYLQRFPFDKIKIDRCFVDDIERPDGSSCIVQAVVNIATARRMTTTAEGVETVRQRELLRSLGCSEMQGYLFSAARPSAEIRQLLNGVSTTRSAIVA